jgi:small-conductance mechanosensitive channel
MDQGKQQRLDVLRVLGAQRCLTDEERMELEGLLQKLDAEEAEAMRPALEGMRQQQAALRNETDRLHAAAAELERIVAGQQQLLADARGYLAQLRARRAALADEYRRVTGRELTAG